MENKIDTTLVYIKKSKFDLDIIQLFKNEKKII